MPALVFVLSIFLYFVSGCTNAPPIGDGSFLILAIPNLRADDISCGTSGDSITPQLDKICNESVHFTHAYTPSVLEASGLASVLTGVYPAEHGVHRNDASFYSSEIKSAPQFLSARGYETIFVSGGVPFLRKVAVSKGFTDFDDSIRSDGSYYRPASQAAKKFMTLLEGRSDESAFFGVITFSDLLFPEVVSPHLEQGEHVEGSHNGKLQDIDAAVGSIRTELKKIKIYDAVTLIIVGLVGRPGTEHDGLAKGLNLYDEMVHVPMIVKPQRKPRDLAPSWKIDEPVTLVDLGATLMKLAHIDSNKRSALPVRDFSEALAGRPFRADERAIFIESDLPRWRGWGPRLMMVRLNQWVNWLPPEPKLFNTYTDRLELRNLISIDQSTASTLTKAFRKYEGLVAPEGEGNERFMAQSVAEKLHSAKPLFSKTSSSTERLKVLQDLALRRPNDWQVLQWYVDFLVTNEDWPALKELIIKKTPVTRGQIVEYHLWQTFVQLKLKINLKHYDEKNDALSGCLYMAAGLKRFNASELESLQSQKTCSDPETRFWINAYIYSKLKRPKEALTFFDFAKATSEKRVEQNDFGKAFWIDGASWDFSVSLPAGPAVFDLFVSLASTPDFSTFVKKKQWP